MKLFKLLLITFVFPFALSSSAQDVSVVKAGSQKSLMDWSSFQAGADAGSQTFRRTLLDDLKRSGWFAQGRPGGSEFILSGRVVAAGGELVAECRVTRSSGASVLGKRYARSANEATRMAHFAADEIVEVVTGQKGIASTRILLVGTASGSKELYLCGAYGQGLRQLTRDGTVSVAPKWGPKGEELTYTSYLKKFPDVYRVNLATGNRKPVANYGGLNTGGVISPNGKELAVILSRDGNPELYVKNLRNERLTRLTRTTRAAEASPTWSPDGASLAYVSDQSGRPQVYTISRRGGKGKRLTRMGSENVAPDWGPNGVVAYASRLGGQYVIGLVDPRNGQTKQLMVDGADYEDPSWARNGRHIVCSRSVNYRSQLYILDTLGDPPIPLTLGRGDWYSPDWSP